MQAGPLALIFVESCNVWRADGVAPFGSAYFRFPCSQPPFPSDWGFWAGQTNGDYGDSDHAADS